MKKVGVSLLASGLFIISFGSVFAQTTVVKSMPANACVSLQSNMRVGMTDSSTGGLITSLQVFLVNQGYFNSAYMGSGRFGPMTQSSVVHFQAAQGLPQTGYVGPLTRNAIQQVSCGGGTVIPPQPTGPVSLYSLSPSSAAIKDTVTITGFGFTNSNTVTMDGSVIATNATVSSSNAVSCTNDPNCRSGIRQTITFNVPPYIAPYCAPGMMCAMMVRSVTPGNYSIAVKNTNGTSNSLNLSVGDATSATHISATGLDAPASLTIGQSGSWTVRVSSANTAGNLHYSVKWGDENVAMSSIMAPQATSVQSTATFSHVYKVAGKYTAYFTITDDNGNYTTINSTTTVNPVY